MTEQKHNAEKQIERTGRMKICIKKMMANRWKLIKSIAMYDDYYKDHAREVKKLLLHFRKKNIPVAVWGAGLMSTAFIYRMDSKGKYIRWVIDKNPALSGTMTPTKHRIYTPEQMPLTKTMAILVTNHNFFAEISRELTDAGRNCLLVDIDKLIAQRKTEEEMLHEAKRIMAD